MSREPIGVKRMAAATGVALSIYAACTWVSLTGAGGGVRVLDAAEAAGCERIGNVHAQTAERVLIFARMDRHVEQELRSLARNRAAEMGGDAVLPLGAPQGGRQDFDVYRCGR